MIPGFSGTSTDSGMRRSSGSPDYFNPSLEEFLSWEVEIPTPVGGKIIGKAGRNVKELRDKTGCKVIIKDIENSRRKQLLVVRGMYPSEFACFQTMPFFRGFSKQLLFLFSQTFQLYRILYLVFWRGFFIHGSRTF